MASPIEEYIRRAAIARGIDPDIAVRVAKHEGGLNNPTNRAGYVKNGFREPSYGPFQLLIGGPGTGFPQGLGNRAVQAGIDPRDPNQWQKGVDFALDEAKRDGWRQWYGAKAAGVPRFGGIRGGGGSSAALGGPGGDPMASPYAGMADGPKGQEMYPRADGGLLPDTQQPKGLLGGLSPEEAAAFWGEDGKEKKGLLSRLSAGLKAVPDAPTGHLGGFEDARRSGSLLLEALTNPTVTRKLAARRFR